MAPSPALPWPRSSISSSFIFSLHSSFHLLCAAVSLPPAASPVPPAFLSALGSFVRVAAPRGRSTGAALSPLAPPGLFLLARYCSHGSLARRHQGTGRDRQSRRGGKEPQQAGCQHGSGTNTHSSPAGPAAPQGQAGPGSRSSAGPGALCTNTGKHMAKPESHNILFSVTKHPSCHTILLAAPFSGVRVGLNSPSTCIRLSVLGL